MRSASLYPLALLLALAAACSVDTSGLGVKSGSVPGASAGEVEDASSSAADGVAAPGNVVPPTQADAGAAAPIVDAGTGADADADAGECDGDGDGFRDAKCGGDDCCDGDPEAFPGQTRYFARPTLCGGWDYDCDGNDQPEFAIVACDRKVFACEGDGFRTKTGCGQADDFFRCEPDGFSCKATASKMLQRCR